MLIAAGLTQEQNRRRLEAEFRMDRVVVGIKIDRSRLLAESVTWGEFWKPCVPFFAADTRLIHRLNRLKSAWRGVLRRPKSRRARIAYCWRFFGLLHHSLRIAQREPRRRDPVPALRQILGFETFTLELAGQAGQSHLITMR